jgi:hypothetical protein
LRTDAYPAKEISRQEAIDNIIEARENHGFKSHCCYNMDGSIDISMEKETEYFGIRKLTGTVKKINPAKTGL